jgi:hypothetical protein
MRENEWESEASHDGDGCDEASEIDRCGRLERIVGEII